MGFLFFVRIDVYYESERIKILYIYIYILKKRKKMENLWKRFFLIEEEEYTVVTNDRMIKKTSRRI